jgi:pimeloyl-ACP methyl ester carboxylesterase
LQKNSLHKLFSVRGVILTKNSDIGKTPRTSTSTPNSFPSEVHRHETMISRHYMHLVILTTLGLAGCASGLGKLMGSAPNKFNAFAPRSNLSPAVRDVLGLDQQFRVNVGPPAATLSVSVIEPLDNQEPRGTILVLHGIWSDSFWMIGTARMLAESGYRAVLVDLRGHGRSTGTQLTYGVREARDLSQVIDALERRRLLVGKLGVYGISYGATTAIHLAGRDDRIQAAVTVAPFSSMRDVVPDYSRTILPGSESVISDETLQQAVDVAGTEGNFDPDLANAIAAIQKTEAPVLIIHGTHDWLVPAYHALRLHEASASHSELVMIPRTGHIMIWFDTTGEVATKTKQWFDRFLGTGKSRGSRDGQESRVEGRESRDESRGTKDKGQRTTDKVEDRKQ